MKKQCVFCQEVFEAKTKRAKYCSDSCKLKFNRGTSITAGKSPEEIRALKKKEMENTKLETIDVKEFDQIKYNKETNTVKIEKTSCDCGGLYCGVDGIRTNTTLPKNHPHYCMRHHPAWQDVTFPCKKCGLIIQETKSVLCSKCMR